MKNTLHFFLILIFLLSGVNSFAEKKHKDSYVCPSLVVTNNTPTICNGSMTNITLSSDHPNATYVWTATTNNVNALTSGNQTNINQIINLISPFLNGSITLNIQAFADGCYSNSQFVNITINPTPTVSISGSTTICIGSSANLTIIGTPNTVVTLTDGGIPITVVLDGSGNAIITVSPTVTTTYSLLSASLNGCNTPLTQTATVTVNPVVIAGSDGSTTICESSTVTIPLFGIITGEQSGGTWTRTSGTGGIFNAVAGTFTPAMGTTNSTFTYIINGNAPCSDDSSVVTIFINPQPNAGLDGMTSVSEESTTPVDLFSVITGGQAGGVWTRTSGTGGTFNAASGTFTPATGATSSTFNYNLTGTVPCVNDMSMATINIDEVPVGMANTSNQTISNSGFSNIILSSSNVPGATFTWTYTANNINGASNGLGTIISQQLSLIDPNLDGYVDYTITPVNNSANGSSFAARVGIQSLLNAETFTASSIKLSPNPVTDILNIENEFQINSIKIYNQLGQLVFGKAINNNQTQLELSNIDSGIYNVMIETEKGTVNHKIVKK